MIVILVDSAVALLCVISSTGSTAVARNSSGPSNVAIMNHFVRTRSRYSRRMIAISLPMSTHPRFNTGGPDFLEENGMQ
jgi:hypothetical protein